MQTQLRRPKNRNIDRNLTKLTLRSAKSLLNRIGSDRQITLMSIILI